MERFAQLMLALGMRAELKVEPLESSVPDGELAVAAAESAAERLREAASWNRAMSQLSAARQAGPPRRAPGDGDRSMSGEPPPERPLDLVRLLETLARHGVDYVVIGGVATQVHGHRRTTMDLDLTPDPEPENIRRLSAALEELEARPSDPGLESGEVSQTDPDRLAVAAIVPPLSTLHGQRPHPQGAERGAELRAASRGRPRRRAGGDRDRDCIARRSDPDEARRRNVLRTSSDIAALTAAERQRER